MSTTKTTMRAKVALLVPAPSRDEVFTADALEQLVQGANLVIPSGDTVSFGYQLPEIRSRVDACLTGWRAPAFSSDLLLAHAPWLRIIVHAIGSITEFIPNTPEAFACGIVICHAANIIAEAVAERTLLLILTGLRRLYLYACASKDGWARREAAVPNQVRHLSGVGT